MDMSALTRSLRLLEEVFPGRVDVKEDEWADFKVVVDVSDAKVWVYVEDYGSVFVDRAELLEIRVTEGEEGTDIEVEFIGETSDPYDLNVSMGEMSSPTENSLCISDSGFELSLGQWVSVRVIFSKSVKEVDKNG